MLVEKSHSDSPLHGLHSFKRWVQGARALCLITSRKLEEAEELPRNRHVSGKILIASSFFGTCFEALSRSYNRFREYLSKNRPGEQSWGVGDIVGREYILHFQFIENSMA